MDDYSDHSEYDKIVLTIDIAGTKPVDIEMFDAESNKCVCFKNIGEGTTMCFGRNCKTNHLGLKIDPREC